MPLRNRAPGFSLLPAWSVPHSPATRVLPSAKQAGKTRNLRLPRDSPPASALYVHDRVSGCARDWSNHPGLEICCGCIPPSDNVAGFPSPHPPPQPRTGPIGSGTRMERPTGKDERLCKTVFSIQTQQVPAKIKKWAFRLKDQAKTQSWRSFQGTPHRGGRKKPKKNPPKNGSSPLAFDGALRESPLRRLILIIALP